MSYTLKDSRPVPKEEYEWKSITKECSVGHFKSNKISVTTTKPFQIYPEEWVAGGSDTTFAYAMFFVGMAIAGLIF
jgi:hypothetical protein